jgi:tetratricopeptide (TPR) repeat protein
MKSFTIADVQKKYGISRRVVANLVKEGFISPARGKRREYRFSFNDVVVMRKANELHAAGISPRKTARFLNQLSQDASGTPAANLRISAAGKELVARDDGGLRNAEGQLVIDFTDAEGTRNVLPLTPADYASSAQNLSASGWFHAAVALEESDPVRAVEYYERAIEIDQKYTDAYINLSCLLIEGEQYIEAFAVCQEAVVHCPDAALLYFNMGIVYEEIKRIPEALKCYKVALDLDAALADAHYNAARLHELLDQPKAAIRHYSEYHRLRR